MNYVDQLNTIEWKVKSQQIKKRDGYKCGICGNKNKLHAHHVIYIPGRKLWDYPGNYLITVCETCHTYEHSIIDGRTKEMEELLLSGMMGIDIYKKFKNKETLIDPIPF